MLKTNDYLRYILARFQSLDTQSLTKMFKIVTNNVGRQVILDLNFVHFMLIISLTGNKVAFTLTQYSPDTILSPGGTGYT